MKTIHPSTAYVELGSSEEDSSGPWEVPLETIGGIEALPVLKSSDGMLMAFNEAKLLFDPGGENEQEIETLNGIPDDTVDNENSNDTPLPDRNKASRPSVNEGGVESKEPNFAVFTKAVQLKLQGKIKSKKNQTKLPCFMIHVTPTKNEAQLNHMEIPEITSPMMQTNNSKNLAFQLNLQEMKNYKNTKITNKMRQKFGLENEYEEESSAMMKTVIFVCIEKCRTFKNPVEKTVGCNSVNHLKVPEDEVIIKKD